MHMTRVSKSDLIDRLLTNRDKHKAEFKQAREEWERQVILRLREVLAAAEADDFTQITDPLKDLPKPVHYLKSYNIAIERLEWETADEVELDEYEFAHFIRDDWDWKGKFTGTTNQYLVA